MCAIGAATIDAVLPQVDAASIRTAIEGVVTPANRLVCDGGLALRAFARRAQIRVHVLPAPGKPNPKAPNLHINNVLSGEHLLAALPGIGL